MSSIHTKVKKLSDKKSGTSSKNSNIQKLERIQVKNISHENMSSCDSSNSYDDDNNSGQNEYNDKNGNSNLIN